MRTTVNIDDAVLRQAKTRAIAENQTLGEFIERAVRQALAGQKPAGKRSNVRLPVDHGKGLHVDATILDSNARLLDRMERELDVDARR